MTGSEQAGSPAAELSRLGGSDAPAIFAVSYLLAVQAAFLITVFHNFLVAPQGNELVGAIPRAIGGTAIGFILISIAWQIVRTRQQLEASAVLERPARHAVHGPVRVLLSELLKRSSVRREVILCYHTVNGDACHVTERGSEADRIVIGVSHAAAVGEQQALIESFVAHEVSHLEQRQTRFETWARVGLHLYVQAAGAFLALTILLVGYLEPEVSDQGVAIASFLPRWNPELMPRFLIPIIIQALISGLVVVLSYFILIRRELLHDLRAIQLVGRADSLTNRFRSECHRRRGKSLAERLSESWAEVVGLHPTVCQRAKTLASRNWTVLDTGVYPLIAGLLLTTPLLLLGPVLQALGVPDVESNMLTTFFGGVLIYCVVRADVGRFSGLLLTHKRWIARLFVYSALMAGSSMLVGVILGLRYAVRYVGWEAALAEILQSQLYRSGSMFAFMVGLLGVMVYLVAVHRLADDAPTAGTMRRLIREAAIIFLVVCAFVAKSSSVSMFQALAVGVALSVGATPVMLSAVTSRCTQCSSSRASALLLSRQCGRCGGVCDVTPSFPS